MYVYFIQQGHGAIKIGMSDEPESRLAELQTGAPRKLRILLKIPFSSRREAFEFERTMHELFSEFRLSGEWFDRRLLRHAKYKGKRIFGGSYNNPIIPDQLKRWQKFNPMRAVTLTPNPFQS